MSGEVLTIGSGVKGLLLEAFKTNASMSIKELEAKTGQKEDTIARTLKRHPEIFKSIRPKDGPMRWELKVQAASMIKAVELTSVEMGVGERKETLAQIARWPLPYDTEITPRQKVEAIAELNKMEGSYPPEKHAVLGDIIIKVVYEERGKKNAENRLQIQS